MKEETHDRLKKIQLFIGVSLLLVSVTLLFKNPGITGYFSADFRSQTLDITIDKSQSYLLFSNLLETVYVSSLRISGEIIGDGAVQIFIEDNGQRFLIFNNVRKKEQGLPSVTGMAVASRKIQEDAEENLEALFLLEPLDTLVWEEVSFSEKEEFLTGPFNNKCVDTCFIEMSLSSQESYKLIFMVQPGTKLKISKIIYTLKDENI
ncbi:hypothetical protein KY342_05750 [Candidatus Woesearchaeota archaeon]|nr:hypothetical protein [Candidatus Woesearchaeota archaeon]